jgi:hypothetical protein
MLDTVLPSLLPLDIKWLLRLQEGFSGPEGVARLEEIPVFSKEDKEMIRVGF